LRPEAFSSEVKTGSHQGKSAARYNDPGATPWPRSRPSAMLRKYGCADHEGGLHQAGVNGWCSKNRAEALFEARQADSLTLSYKTIIKTLELASF